jgi:GNAT superfamily N-acetyltransferase
MHLRRLEATEADAVSVGMFLFETFAQEHSFAGRKTEKVNGHRGYAHIWQHLERGAVWVVEDHDGIAGSIAVMKRKHWWSDGEYLADGWFYVRPEKRASRAALLLIRAAEQFAGGTMLKIELSHSEDLNRKDAFFRKMGFARMGASYAKET